MPTDFTKIVQTAVSTKAKPEEAADTLRAPIEDAFIKHDVPADELEFEAAWGAVLEAVLAASTEREVDRLVELVQQTKTRGGQLKRPDGTVCKHWSGEAWTAYPALGATVREKFNASPPATTAEQWARLNGFVAKLNAAGVGEFSLYALWLFRDALETSRPLTLRESPGGGDVPPAKSEDVSVDELMPAIVAWLENCGPKLATLAVLPYSYKSASQKNDPGALGKLAMEAGLEHSGHNVERWAFWRNRLHEISEARDEAGGREKVAKLAFTALSLMNSSKSES